MIKKQKLKNILFVLYLLLLLFFYVVYQGRVEMQRKIENDLQKEIKILKSKYVDISTQLQYMQIEGVIEEEVKRRNLNLIKEKIPYVIYVEPKKTKRK